MSNIHYLARDLVRVKLQLTLVLNFSTFVVKIRARVVACCNTMAVLARPMTQVIMARPCVVLNWTNPLAHMMGSMVSGDTSRVHPSMAALRGLRKFSLKQIITHHMQWQSEHGKHGQVGVSKRET